MERAEVRLVPRAATRADDTGDAASRLIQRVLSVCRAQTGMEVAFLSRVADERRTFLYVDDEPWFCPISPGASDPLEETYCARVLDGRIPGLLVDAAREPAVSDLRATRDLSIGSHLSVPVLTADGDVFGTLCCFSRKVDPDLGQRAFDVMTLLAALIGDHLEPLVARYRADEIDERQIARVIEVGGPVMALQPIINLTSNSTSGYEALARFPLSPGRPTPDVWFAAADRLGMGAALEASAVRSALRLLPRIPEGRALAVNVSAPALLADPTIEEALLGADGPCLVLELTENHKIAQDDVLNRALVRIRAHGIRLAIDDAGSGYSGLQRILALAPDVVKLDRTLIHGIASHPGRQAMCVAMVTFTERTGATLVVEGVETIADLNTLRELGVSHAQGFLLGHPTIWPELGEESARDPSSRRDEDAVS